MHQKPFGGWAPPGSAGGAYSAPPDLAGLRGWPREGGGGIGENGNKERVRGMKGEGKEEQGSNVKKRGGEIGKREKGGKGKGTDGFCLG